MTWTFNEDVLDRCVGESLRMIMSSALMRIKIYEELIAKELSQMVGHVTSATLPSLRPSPALELNISCMIVSPL